jgi:hypothetical protein
MNVKVTYLGNSATLLDLVSVKRMKATTEMIFPAAYCEEDVPEEWIRAELPSGEIKFEFQNDGLEYQIERR